MFSYVQGCIPAEELKFVMNHLPGEVRFKQSLCFLFEISSFQVPVGEIESMIRTVDRNKDGKISYSEFRYISRVYTFYNRF